MDKTGLLLHNNNSKYELVLDPDNVFWGILNQKQDACTLIPRKILSLYEKVKDNLDKQMHDFRFNANLTAIYIDPTDKCNSNCPYCYVPRWIRKNGRSMSRKELIFILEKIAEYFSAMCGSAYGGKNQKRKAVIVFHAAEPLLVKEIIFEGIERFSRQFKFGLQTNAILLEKEDIKFLKEYRVGVGISLDSYLPSINNRLRPTSLGNENLKMVVKAIEWFDGYEGLNVITTITKFNVTNLPGMIRFLHSKKVPCVLLNPVRLTQKSSHTLKPDESLMVKYFIKAVDKAIELSKKSNHRIIIGNFANIILGIVAPDGRRLMCDISPCGGGRCFLTITASGRMIPCGEFIGLKGFSGGNIFKTSLKQAMQSGPFKKIRQRFVEKISECKICIFRNICGAPCPAELHSLGNMFQPSIFCEFYKEIISYAFKLIAEGKEKYCFRKEGLNNLEYEYNLRVKR